MPHPIVRNRRLFSSSVLGAVSPTDFANLDHWWKADSFALSDGTRIGGAGQEWVDHIGGSTYYGRQATAAFKPQFKTNIANGLPAILFSSLTTLATQEFLDSSNGNPLNKMVYAGDYTILSVVQPKSGASSFAGGCIIGDAYTRGGVGLQSGTSMFADNGTTALVPSVTFTMDTTYSVGFEGSSGTTSFYLNNVSQSSGSLTGMTVDFIGASANINGNSANSVRYTGYIMEILIYGRALTSDERNALQTRYFNRWGI